MDDNKLESISQNLKSYLTKYDTQCILGHLSFLMTCITNGAAQDQLGKLTSPMRQLYYLAGLLVSQESSGENEIQFSDKDWSYIVDKLTLIEQEYYNLFLPDDSLENVREEWKNKAAAAMPTFLSYFNLGPLNFEEQIIEQIRGTFTNLDDVIVSKTGITTEEFLLFYDNLDSWCQYNFQSLSLISKDEYPLRPNWKDYTKLEVGPNDEAPETIKAYGIENQPMYTYVVDPGIKNRFKLTDVANNGLSEEKVKAILSMLTLKRSNTQYLYYTEQNPLNIFPIIELGNGLYQVFEEKRILHAIYYWLEEICKENENTKSRLIHHKGNYLETKIVSLFRKFFGDKAHILRGYYVDGCEQDIIIDWRGYLFVIEAKAYNNKEPFRDVDKAFRRIKQDFNRSIGAAYEQTKRVELKMKEGKPFDLTDKEGNVLKTINPNDFDGNDFYLIVNQESFGQIQADLSTLLDVKDGFEYPWAVRFDDLEVFILTLMARKKKPDFFIDFLIFREYLHGHIICSDEGEICGGYLTGDLTQDMAESEAVIITTPDLAAIFDEHYRLGMGFKNEKYWKEKHDGNTMFWG